MCGHGVPVWLRYNRSLVYIVTCRLTVSESCFPTGFVNTVLRSGRSVRAHPAFLFVAHYSCTGPFRRFVVPQAKVCSERRQDRAMYFGTPQRSSNPASVTMSSRMPASGKTKNRCQLQRRRRKNIVSPEIALRLQHAA